MKRSNPNKSKKKRNPAGANWHAATPPRNVETIDWDEYALAGNPATVTKKRHLLTALYTCFGIVTPACKLANVAIRNHWRWVKEDPEYDKAVNSLTLVKKDFAEYQLFRLASQGDSQCVREVNKKINRDRGYGDKLDIGVGLNPGTHNKRIWIPDNGRDTDRTNVIKLTTDSSDDITKSA